ncbi:11805_t:CDS:10 [Diversispora eburnea]|uniref:11805_t:CDS:1 n=1 Tax=Diversispora eburnea TaxID=1213867 RepID=A0A9N8VIU7_9GLOM|nr:11805_t:CDS:10 [Diversispora eburnea]
MVQSSNKRRRTEMEQVTPTSQQYGGAPYESTIQASDTGIDQSGINYNDENCLNNTTDNNNLYGNDAMNSNHNQTHDNYGILIIIMNVNVNGPSLPPPQRNNYVINPVPTENINLNTQPRGSIVNFTNHETNLDIQQRATQIRQRPLLPNTALITSNNCGQNYGGGGDSLQYPNTFSEACDLLIKQYRNNDIYSLENEARLIKCLEIVKKNIYQNQSAAINVFINFKPYITQINTPTNKIASNYRSRSSSYLSPNYDPSYTHRVISNAWGPVMLPYDNFENGGHNSINNIYNSFYVSQDQYDRILRANTPKPGSNFSIEEMPITYRLICRKSGCLNYENMCDWPEESIHAFEKRSYYDRDNYEHFEGNDSSVDISSYILSGINKIILKQCFCDICHKKLSQYVLVIEVQIRETRDFIMYWARSQLISDSVGKSLVQHLTGTSSPSMAADDDLIVTSNLNIDLRCPYTYTRIKEPARVFKRLELDNKRKELWMCPICE